jgi:hypothetical protein
MSKDTRRYAAAPYGHAAPWNRVPSPPPPPVVAARRATPWPWVVALALVVAAVGWLVYDAALG